MERQRNLKAYAMRLEGRRFMVVAMDFLEATRTARSIDSRVQYAGLIASLPGVYVHPLRLADRRLMGEIVRGK